MDGLSHLAAPAEPLRARLQRLHSIEGQIATVETEVNRRRLTYPKLVSAGHMDELDAHNGVASMEAVLATLKGIERAGGKHG